MADQITLEEALRIVSFRKTADGTWVVRDVFGGVWGSVYGDVGGTVGGTINGREWQSIETPKDKLKRLIEEGADKEQLLEAFNQLED